jgi:hypothetical protein
VTLREFEVSRIFLLSPANCGGERAKLIYREQARFELAIKLRTPKGATLGEVFSFLSGLYFRGKLTYANKFAQPPRGVAGQQVITTNRGLVRADAYVTIDELRAMGCVPIDANNAQYRKPLEASVNQLAKKIGRKTEVVLLGSVASGKYVDILVDILGDRLLFPIDFVGRGDMSRGGLMLRCVREDRELEYAPVASSKRRGKRPAKLKPVPGILKEAR